MGATGLLAGWVGFDDRLLQGVRRPRVIRRSFGRLRLALTDRLPEGTLSIGIGLAISGLAAYAFITVSSRDLGADSYSPVALLWALSFLFGIGFYIPLEQETARIVASRASQGLGSSSVVRAAALLGCLMALVLGLVALAAVTAQSILSIA